jgi:glycosyltransferase involved in cell wall biosynthesis
MIPVWIALALIAAMLIVAAAKRFPVWNPTYVLGALFALQIGAGFSFARRLGMDVPLDFSLPLLGAYLLTLGLLVWYSIRDREVVRRNPDLQQQFGLITLTPGAVRIFVVVMLIIAVHNTVVNVILIERWETLPVVAYNLYRQGLATSMPGVVLPEDVGRPFIVPFFSNVADHLVNPAVVIYFALIYCSKQAAPPGRRVGFRSMSWWVHSLFGLVILNAAIVQRRNPLLIGIATAILLLYLLGKLPRKAVVAGAVVLLIGTVALGQWRRGTQVFQAAEELRLPPVVGNTMVYEPLVYIGSGVPNFLQYWAADHTPAWGRLHLGSLLPAPIESALGLEFDRTQMLQRMFREGFVLPGQTLRTPWFEAFFDFGWAGVYALALLFPTGVHWLYRRTLIGPGQKKPSLAFFTMAKFILIFPFISLLFLLPFWTTAAFAVLIDWRLIRSVRLANPQHRIQRVLSTILITLENPERSGAPRMALQYARALVSAGHRVLAVCGPPSEAASSILPDLQQAGVEVRRVPSFAPRTAMTLLRRLRDVIRGENIDCVVGFQQRDRVLACLTARLAGTRCVISAQSQHVFRGGPLERRLKERIYAWAMRGRADLVICASEVVEEELRRRFAVDGGRTTVLPNGIDVQAFPTFGVEEARTVRRDLDVSDGELLFLNVGRIDPQKGHDLLLDAFLTVAERHPHVRLAIVGSVGRSSASSEARKYQDRLRSVVLAAGLETRVLFLGWREDVPALLAAADLYVQPSRWEGWPVAVVEAMAAGLPVVASDCAGRPRGFVDGEHGWIVPTGNVASLEKALEEAIATDVGELRRMGASARSLAERHYDIHRLGEHFVRLVEGVVAA